LPHLGEDLRSIWEGGIATQPIEPFWYADIKGRVGGRGGRERINSPSVGTRNMITASGSPTTGATVVRAAIERGAGTRVTPRANELLGDTHTEQL
jgi:hypothetical protein